MTERVPSPTEYIWFGLKWNIALVITGLIAYPLFSTGNQLLGFFLILLFVILLVASWIRLSRRAKRGIVNRVKASTEKTTAKMT